MVKKNRIATAAAALLLILLIPFASAAAARIWDECGLFDDSEKLQISTLISKIRAEYEMDVGVLTTNQVPKNKNERSEDQTAKYADAWYEDKGMGLGEDRAGLLYVIDMNNRVSYISTAGVMIDYINDSRKEELLSAADVGLGKGKYGSAATMLLHKLTTILSRGIQEGHFRYDDVTGERLTGLYNKLTTGEIVLVGAGGVLAAGLTVLGINIRYGLKRKTYKFNRDTQSSVNYTVNEKTFLRQTVTRTPISSGGGGRGGGGGGGRGSGVHISSGGMSHGGGGHHFCRAVSFKRDAKM